MPNFAPYAEPNMEFAALASEERIQRAVAALTAHNIEASVVDNAAVAKEAVLAMLPAGANVYTSQSRTLRDTGITAAIDEGGNFDAVRPKVAHLSYATERDQIRRMTAAPDYIVGSVVAVTETGQVLAASASGSQLGAYVAGAGHVIWVVGAQKIVRDLDEGQRRLREYSLPWESDRLQGAFNMASFIAKLLIFEKEGRPGRTRLVFVRENLGF